MQLNELIYQDEYISENKIDNIEINHISVTKEDITSGTLFVLQKSIKFDINKIINYIINKKPKAILCDYDIDIFSDKILILKTENTRKLLPFLLVRFHSLNLKKMRFIGITGTAGKTTTATMIHHILNFAGIKTAFIGTGKMMIGKEIISDSNYSMTTPDPITLYPMLKKMEESGCEAVVMEISSHALSLHKVLPISFDISVFTNLTSEHMDFHYSMEEYYKSKMLLFSQSALGIFNMDDQYSRKGFSEVKCKKTSVGILYPANTVAKNIEQDGFSSTEYIVCESSRIYKIHLNFGGAYNIYNSLLAIKSASELGIKPCIIKEALGSLNKVEGRMELIHSSPYIFIDYAHTACEMENALKFLKSAKNTEQKIISLFGCGGDRDKSKRPEMAEIAEKYSDYIVVTSDNSRGESEREIIKDILPGFKNNTQRKVITSRIDAIEHAIKSARKNDIIVLFGKGHEKYNIDKTGYHSFDEKAIVKSILKDEEVVF